MEEKIWEWRTEIVAKREHAKKNGFDWEGNPYQLQIENRFRYVRDALKKKYFSLTGSELTIKKTVSN